MKTITIFAALAAGAIFSQQAMADSTGTGWYAGGGLGLARVKDTADTSRLSTFNRDSNNLGAKLLVGYRYNEYLGIEGAYTRFGKEKYNYSATGESGAGHIQVDAFALAATARLPLGNALAVLGKLGVASVQSKYRESWVDSGTPGSSSESQTTAVPMIGLGAEYAFSKNLSLRAEYETYGKARIVGESGSGVAKVKADMFSLGVGYHFQ